MSLRALLLAAPFLCGCSLLFDPTKVPPLCPSAPPPAPAWLEATAGDPGAALRWRWPRVEGVQARLCTTVPGGAELCRAVPADACDAGLCELLQPGLAGGVRVSGRVLSVAGCERTSASPSSSASAIDPSNPDEWTLAQSNCTTVTPGFAGGVLSLEQQGGACSSTLTVGDEGWGSLTLDAELRVSPAADGVQAGLVLQQAANGHRLRATAVVPTSLRLESAELEQRLDGRTALVATGTHTLSSTEWTHVRLVVDGPVLSWQTGLVGGALTERLRWTDVAPRVGRLGLTADGAGRFELRGLTVSNRPVPLPPSASRATALFGVDGGATGLRALGVPLGSNPCPAWPAGCAVGCAPPAGARCGVLSRTALYFDYSLVALPQPPGLDPARPTTVSLRFAFPSDAGTAATRVLGSRYFPLLDSAPGELKVAGVVVGDAGVAPGVWHLASFTFAPDAGLRATLDGVEVQRTLTWPLPGGSLHLGAFTIGNTFNASEVVLHELSVDQP